MMYYRAHPFEIIIDVVFAHAVPLRCSRLGPAVGVLSSGDMREPCLWCRTEVGPIGWGYNGGTFYFKDPNAALAFKMRWG